MKMLQLSTCLAFWVLLSSFTSLKGSTQQLGWLAVSRPSTDTVRRAILLVDPSLNVSLPGHIVAWNLYISSKLSFAKVSLQVWRPFDLTKKRYTLTGQTKVRGVPKGGHVHFVLLVEDRIVVEKGDVLALYFNKYNPIPWSRVKCEGGNEHLFKYNPFRHSRPQMGMVMAFERPMEDWQPCRQYSVNATIATSDELHRFHNVDSVTDSIGNNRSSEARYYPLHTHQMATAKTTPSSSSSGWKAWHFIALLTASSLLARMLNRLSI